MGGLMCGWCDGGWSSVWVVRCVGGVMVGGPV